MINNGTHFYSLFILKTCIYVGVHVVLPGTTFYCVLCIMYYVLCIMYCVLCIVYYVLCIMYYVLCIVYYIDKYIDYVLFCIFI